MPPGWEVLRADSAYYGHDVVAAALRRGARLSITARQDKAVRRTIATITPNAWTTISYTNAIFDGQQQRWISNAEVAEIPLHRVHLQAQSPPTSPPGCWFVGSST